MHRLKELATLALPLAIALLVLAVMFEVYTFPRAHDYMGYLIAGYLTLCLVVLTGRILRDTWQKVRGGGE